MIQELTIDNLLNLGLTEEEAAVLFNSEDEYNLQCNAGNFYTSKAENIFYTGFEYWRFIYLTKNLKFPFNTPELVFEYFDLSLENYLESKKEKLKTLYNEIFETQNFIKEETDFANENILYWKNKRLTISKHSIDVFQGYLYFLENYKPQSEPKKAIELKNFFKNTTPLQLEKIKDEFSTYKGKDLAIVIHFLIEKERLNIIKGSTSRGLFAFVKLFGEMGKNGFEAVRKNLKIAPSSNYALKDNTNLELNRIENTIDSIYKVG